MKITEDSSPIKDNGGMRMNEDRRISDRPFDFPDRRSGSDRRKTADRRSGIDRRSPEGFRAMLPRDRRRAWMAIGLLNLSPTTPADGK